MKQYTIAPSVPIRCSPIIICLVWENKGKPSDTRWSCVALMLNCHSPDFLCSFCCSCCFSSEAYTSKAASERKSNHGLFLCWAENPPATLRATTCSFPVRAILRTQHWSIALSSSFMVKDSKVLFQQFLLLLCHLLTALQKQLLQQMVFSLFSFCRKALSRLTDQKEHHTTVPIHDQIWHPWKEVCRTLLLYEKFSWITIKYRLPQKLCQCHLIFLWKEKHLSKYKIYMHTVLSHPCFFAGFTVLGFSS